MYWGKISLTQKQEEWLIKLLKDKLLENKKKFKWKKVQKTWEPEVGDKIEGKLIKIIPNVGKYEQTVYLLEKDDKTTKIWGKTHLNQLMEAINLDDYIRITYNGFINTKNDRQMKKFNLERREEYG